MLPSPAYILIRKISQEDNCADVRIPHHMSRRPGVWPGWQCKNHNGTWSVKTAEQPPYGNDRGILGSPWQLTRAMFHGYVHHYRCMEKTKPGVVFISLRD